MIKTFRGQMADGSIDTIVLHTNTGATGYRIIKFELFPNAPGTSTVEGLVKIYKESQTVVDNTVDFSDQRLLAAAYYIDQDNPQYSASLISLFDKEIFNQDIYLTYIDSDSATPMNYYIELEQVKLSLDQNTVATLKDIRNVTAP
tara:strand:+ start:248 stop:682 length:435 start_codon:yes stop_codon:yes gene_type:complete